MEQSLAWFWAKLGDHVWPAKYHPVVCHLTDVGCVARRLWADACRPEVRRWAAGRLGLSDDAAGKWLAFWVAAHDIGKITPCFQSQGESGPLTGLLQGHGFDPGIGKEPHGKTGTKILADELARPGGPNPLDRDLARKVAVAVGGHHGAFQTDWDGSTAVLGGGPWEAARRDLLRAYTGNGELEVEADVEYPR